MDLRPGTTHDEVTGRAAWSARREEALDLGELAHEGAEALGLWRGLALKGLSRTARLEACVAGLMDRRLTVYEDYCDARLAGGAAGELVPDLRRHLAGHPFRERAWGALMRAQYRSGDVSGALGSFAQAHALLREQLGVDPGPELVALHRAILARDPRLMNHPWKPGSRPATIMAHTIARRAAAKAKHRGGTIMPDVDLDGLRRLIGSPPRETQPVDWATVQQALGLRLPTDFIAFASAYGPIVLGEFIWLWSPAGAAARYNHATHEWLRALRDLDPPSYPYTFWPEPGGLLMWGWSCASHHFFWDTAASTDPQRWPTVVYSYLSPALAPQGAGVYSGPAWRRLERPMTDVIAALVVGGPGPDPGLDFAPLPARYTPDLSVGGTQDRLDAPGRPATPTPEAVDRIVAAAGAVGPSGPTRWSDEQAPGDYRALIDRIGPGALGGRLLLHAPGAPAGFEMATEHARAAATVHVPAAVHPQPGGLRLWGRFTTGETCWWAPAWYDPDGWPVVICAADGVGWQRLNLTATRFMHEWLAGRMDLPVLAPNALPADQSLRPALEPPPAPPPPSTRRRDPLAQLAALLGPPDGETVADLSIDERRLGTRLPADFKRLHAAYAELSVGGISIPEPGRLADYHESISAFALGDRPAFPGPGGLLYCAGTERRDTLWWDTTDPDPDAWSVVVERASRFTPFPGNLTQLLVQTLTGRPPHLTTGTVSAPPCRPR